MEFPWDDHLKLKDYRAHTKSPILSRGYQCVSIVDQTGKSSFDLFTSALDSRLVHVNLFVVGMPREYNLVAAVVPKVS